MTSRALKLILVFLRVSVQNLTAYRLDFLMRGVMSVVHLVAELMGVWMIFHNCTEIRGWTWKHMLVLVGVFRIVAGGIRMSIVPNMRRLLEDIREGTLDFVLLRPVNAQFLVSIREFVIWRITDVLIGLSLAFYGCFRLTGHVPVEAVIRFAFVMLAAGAIIYSIWLALATLCFWFVRIDNIEMVFWNIFEAGRYPIVIYPPWVRFTLTFLIPLAFITTVPAGSLVGDQTQFLGPWAPVWALAIAAASTIGATAFWRYGLKHYSGASA